MKKGKVMAVLLTLTLISAMLIGSARPVPAEEKMTDIKIVSAYVGSGTYVNIIAMSAMIAAYSKWLKATPIPTPGWIDALRLLKDGRADIAGTGSIDIAAMMKGIKYFKNEQYTGIRWLWPFMVPPVTVTTRRDSPFRTFNSLRDARVGIGLPGSSMETDARAIIGVLGFEPKKIVHLAANDLASALKDRTVDVVFHGASIGSPQVVEHTNINDCYFIPLDNETWNKLEALGLGYVRSSIPAKTYRLQDYEVPVVAKGAYMVASERLSDEIVYEVSRCFWYDIKKTVTINPKVIGECVDTVKKSLDIPGPCPMHPGAMKYFKEKGMLK